MFNTLREEIFLFIELLIILLNLKNAIMKNIIIIIALSTFVTFNSWAQEFRDLDKSPMDMAYLPDNFAHDRKFAPERKLGNSAIIRVTYSRPQKKDREVFGGMVKYGEVWRLGANEAIEMKAYQDIKIGGHTLIGGTYAVFAIPGENEWTIIFNTDLDEWGQYSYKEEHDALRVKASVKSNDAIVEALSIQFEDSGNGMAMMRIAWDQTIAELPIEVIVNPFLKK